MSTYRNNITLKGFLGRDAELHVNTNQRPSPCSRWPQKARTGTDCRVSFVSHTEWHRIIANGSLRVCQVAPQGRSTSKSRADCKASRTRTTPACSAVYGKSVPVRLLTSEQPTGDDEEVRYVFGEECTGIGRVPVTAPLSP